MKPNGLGSRIYYLRKRNHMEDDLVKAIVKCSMASCTG